MKKNVFAFVVTIAVLIGFFSSSWAFGIVVDGFVSDWYGIDPIMSDDAGDIAGAPDLLDVWVTNDEENVYFLLSFVGFTNPFNVFLDTDKTWYTGFPVSGIGAEYTLRMSDYSYLQGVDIGIIPGAATVVFGPDANVWEASVSIEALSILTSGLDGFDFVTLEDSLPCGSVSYNFQPVPEPCTILLLSSGLVPLMRMRKKFLKK